jgi:hypothetical protein
MTHQAAVRVTWLVTLAIFFGLGVGAVWWPSSQTISAIRLEAAHDYEAAERNEDDVRHASQLKRIAARVQGDLRSWVPSASPAQATAVLLRLLAAESRRDHVSIRSIVPSSATAPGQSIAAPSTGPFEATHIELTLAGRFIDVLQFVADLPRRDSLIEVDDMTLNDLDRHSDAPVLTVTLHTTLYRFRGRAATGEDDASSSV